MLRRRKGGGGGVGERRRRCCRRHMSPRFCHSPLELGRLPAVPCHSAWLETAGFHGGMFGCAGIEPSAWNNIIKPPFFFFFKLFSFYQLASIAIYLAACGPTQPELMPNRFCENSPSIPARPNNPIPCKSAALILAVEG